MSKTPRCRKCGDFCASLTCEAFACDNCGDEYRVAKEPGYSQIETELAEAIKVIEELNRVFDSDCDREEILEKQLEEARAEIERKDKLIEQMREALEYDRIALLVMVEQKLINPDGITLKANKAALSAAERIKE